MGLIDAITAVPGVRCLDDCDEWCVGLPLERIRVLDSVEAELLQRQVDTQFSRQRCAAVTFASAFAVLYFSTIISSSVLLFWLTAGGALLMSVFVLWLVAEPTSWLRRYKVLQADITCGVVHCFRHESCAGTLEVLPRTEIVYKPNEFSPRKWRHAKIVSTAKTPPFASIACEWLQPVEGDSGHVLVGKRTLSAGELDEIKRIVECLWKSPKRNAIYHLIWLGFVVWLWHTGNDHLCMAAAALMIVTLLRIAPDIARAVALQRDFNAGHVLINRKASRLETSIIPIGSAAEYLPQAKVRWTVGGYPAEWRKIA